MRRFRPASLPSPDGTIRIMATDSRCLEGEKFGYQAGVVVDALAAEGMHFDGYEGTGRPGSLRAPVVREDGL
jgi:hypothetical protein